MQILNNVELAHWHTLQAGALAKSLIIVEELEELDRIPRNAFMLGGGSNVIFVGEVARPIAHLRLTGQEVTDEDAHYVYLRVAAGELWNDLSRTCADAGWYGLENLALIPGTVGAAPVQNIGAYGVEVASAIHYVHVYDRDEQCYKDISAQACAFAYRQSHFKGLWRDRYIITGVTFRLAKQRNVVLDYPDLASRVQADAQAKEIYDAVCAIRQSKLPDPEILPNAGSFFHNPIIGAEQAQSLARQWPEIPVYPYGENQAKLSAGWCIEQCGFKGRYHGSVGMYEHHALILVNKGGTGQDILGYAGEVQAAVRETFGLDLHIEPVIIGENYE